MICLKLVITSEISPQENYEMYEMNTLDYLPSVMLKHPAITYLHPHLYQQSPSLTIFNTNLICHIHHHDQGDYQHLLCLGFYSSVDLMLISGGLHPTPTLEVHLCYKVRCDWPLSWCMITYSSCGPSPPSTNYSPVNYYFSVLYLGFLGLT